MLDCWTEIWFFWWGEREDTQMLSQIYFLTLFLIALLSFFHSVFLIAVGRVFDIHCSCVPLFVRHGFNSTPADVVVSVAADCLLGLLAQDEVQS